jgi:hypothetical protein
MRTSEHTTVEKVPFECARVGCAAHLTSSLFTVPSRARVWLQMHWLVTLNVPRFPPLMPLNP